MVTSFSTKNNKACVALAHNLRLTMINECIYTCTLMVRVNEVKYGFYICNETCIYNGCEYFYSGIALVYLIGKNNIGLATLRCNDSDI